MKHGIQLLILLIKDYPHLKKIFIISLLLPFRRIFFSIANYILGMFVPSLTWFILFSLGKNPVLDGENIFIEDNQSCYVYFFLKKHLFK